MAPQKKRNKNLPFRLLLLAGYLFLFATQFNYRYYAVSNFFVYGNNTASVVGTANSASPLQKAERCLSYRSNTKRPSHLSIDKRFQFRDFIRVNTILAAPPVVYTLSQKKYFLLSPVCHFPDLPTNSLRGPPVA